MAVPQLSVSSDALAEPILRLLMESEQIMLTRIAKSLAKGIDSSDWAERKLLEVQLLQAGLRRDLTQVEKQVAGQVAVALVTAYNRGTAAGIAQILGAGGTEDLAGQLQAGLPAIEALYTDTVGSLRPVYSRVLREFDDVYRRTVAETVGQVLVGTQTTREAAQSVLDKFAVRGVTGFVDRAGRRWDLGSYAEMAARSATARAAVDGQTDRLQANGYDLVYVSNSPQECSKCRPWEGKVLSLSGAAHLDADVAGTIEQARRAGLMHPGCTHSVSLYLPGVTRLPTDTANPSGYEDRQRLRALERRVRAAKRQQAVALDAAAEKKAAARVRVAQAAVRDHVAETGAKRQPWRESPQKARVGEAENQKPKRSDPAASAKAAKLASNPALTGAVASASTSPVASL